MKIIDRYEKYKEESFDKIILEIQKGNIKCGKYLHLIKVNKNKIIKDKELFNNGSKND